MIFLKTSKIFSTATRLIFAQNYKGQMQKPLSPPSPALMERALWTGCRSLLPALMPSANPFALFRLHLSFTFLFKNQTSLAFTSNLPESELKQPKNVNSCQMLDSSKKKKNPGKSEHCILISWQVVRDHDEFLTLVDTFSNVNVLLRKKLCSND